jgi:hypothetical protein
MSTIKKIIAEYNGEEFELKIGEVYEFSDYVDFKHVFTDRLLAIGSNLGVFKTIRDSFNYIRPLQTKPIAEIERER